jgi:hypothetical protein
MGCGYVLTVYHKIVFLQKKRKYPVKIADLK